MPPNGKAELAHPEAADWVLGTLGPAQARIFRVISRAVRTAGQPWPSSVSSARCSSTCRQPPSHHPGSKLAPSPAGSPQQPEYPAPKADRRSDPEDQAATRVQPVRSSSLRPQTRPGSSRDRSSSLRPETRPGSSQDRSSSPRPSRRPGRRSLSCLCGDVIKAASRLSLPPPLPSSLLPSSFRSALAEARSPQPHSRDPAPCHRGGQADRRRRSHRPSDSPAGWPKLDLRYDRPWTQGASRQ